MIEKLLLLCLVVFAVAAVSTSQLRRAVIYLSVFSLLASLAYLLYQAPDVAIAEAVIGCGLATVLYLAALRKQRLITIYYVHEHDQDINDQLTPEADRLLRAIEQLLAGKELETHVVHTTRPGREILDRQDFDLLLVEQGEQLTVYGRTEDYHLDAVEALLAGQTRPADSVRVVRLDGEGI